MPAIINEFKLFFSSIKLTIVLLIVIAVASVIGTLIPQQDAAHEFLHGRAAWVVYVFNVLQLGNIFRSVWFTFLLGLLSLNLVVCSWNRLPAAWKLFTRKCSPGRGNIFHAAGFEWSHTSPARLPEETKRIEALMKKSYRRVSATQTADGTIICGDKGAISYLGAYIIHAGVLVIILGALVGIFFGFKGFANIMEGDSVQAAQLLSGKGVKQLGFAVRCDKFTVEFYETGQPKMFRSDLTFSKGNQVLKKGALMVNHPIEIEGIRFYQSSYGSIADKAQIRVLKNDRDLAHASLTENGQLELPDKAGHIKLLRLETNLMELGPAVKLQAKIGDQIKELWVFQDIEEIKRTNPGILQKAPAFDPDITSPYRLILEKLDEKYYTGIQVNYDPGAPLVGIGALLMIYGLIVAFFYPHRQFFVRLQGENNATVITLAGKTNKDQGILKREMIKLMAAIKT